MSPSMMTSWWKDNPPQHLPGLLHGTAAEFPDRVLISRRQGQSWVDLTSQQFLDHVNSVARGLVAAGVEPEDRVVLMAKTRYEWALLDLAILSTGAALVLVLEAGHASRGVEDEGIALEEPGHLLVAYVARPVRASPGHPVDRHETRAVRRLRELHEHPVQVRLLDRDLALDVRRAVAVGGPVRCRWRHDVSFVRG